MKTIFTASLLFVSLLIQAQTTYYIDPAGNNGNNGSISSPWLTLTYACAHAKTSGNIIHANAGTYIETSQSLLTVGVSIEGEGVSSIIKSRISAANTPTIILSSGTQGTKGNQSISKIKMDGDALTAYSAIKVTARSNVLIHDCTFIDFNNNGVIFNGALGDGLPTTWATGNKFYNNIVTNCSKYVVGSEGRWALGINGQDGMLIYDNTMTQTSRPAGNNGYLIKGVEGYNKGLKIYNNTLTRAPAVSGSFDFAIEFWNCLGGIEIYNNILKGSIDLGGVSTTKGTYAYSVYIHNNSIGEALLNSYEGTRGVLCESNIHDVIIEKNYFNNIATGVFFSQFPSAQTVENVYIQYNIFNNIGSLTSSKGWGINWSPENYTNHTVNNINVWNNVFIGNTTSASNMWGIGLPSIGAATNVSIRNNIVQGFNYGPTYTYGGTGVSIDYLSIENNIFYNNGNSNSPRYSNLTPTHNTTQNNLTSNPLFVSSSDYHLQATSPAINAGVNVGLTTDYDGITVPYNYGIPDIGAYEWGLGYTTTYYVSTAANGGSNSNNGSIGSPWLTLSYACAHATTSGDIIHVNAGTFTETQESMLAAGVNLEGDGVTSILHSHYSTDCLIYLYSGSNTNGNQSISNLQFEGGTTVTDLVGQSAIKVIARNNVTIHDCTFRNFQKEGVIFYSGEVFPDPWITGCSFYNNIVTNCSRMTPGSGDSGEGALCIGGTQEMLVYGNTITNNLRASGNNGYGIKYYGDEGLNKGLKIYNNTITQTSSGDAPSGFNFCIEMWSGAGGFEIYNNVFHGCLDISNCQRDLTWYGVTYPEGAYSFGTKIYDNFIGWDSPMPIGSGDGEFGMRIEANCDYMYVYNNHFKNLGVGIESAMFDQTPHQSQHHMYFYYNVFENVGPSSSNALKGWGIRTAGDINCTYNEWHILNNVFSGKITGGTTAYAIPVPGGYTGDVTTNFYIRNNIVQNFSYCVEGDINGTPVADNVHIENNIFFNNGYNNAVHSNTTHWTNYTYQNNKILNPLFVSSSDFHLLAGSPGIDAGIDVGLTLDYVGNTVTPPVDIGAYEFISGDNHPPSIQDQGFRLNENSPGGTAVGTVVSSDPDAGQTLTYSIVSGNSNGAFAINALNGVLYVANGAALTVDFSLVVKVQDNGVGELSSQATIAIEVVPTGIELTGNTETIKVYPNPVSDELIIEFKGNNERQFFKILNSVGQIVFNGNLTEKTVVQTTDFSPGIYLLKIENRRSFVLKKIVKI